MNRILVIEDTELVRTILLDILEEAGYEVIEAGDGEGGISAYLEYGADLVITDLVMPGKGGVEVVQEIQKYTPHTRFLVLSGRDCGNMFQDLIGRATPTQLRTLVKPVREEDLLEAVEELLAGAA
jgi:DNA-binding NarL/FixJ family response regulator